MTIKELEKARTYKKPPPKKGSFNIRQIFESGKEIIMFCLKNPEKLEQTICMVKQEARN